MTLQSDIPADIRPIAAAIVKELATKPVGSHGSRYWNEVRRLIVPWWQWSWIRPGYSNGEQGFVLFELSAGKSFGFSFLKEYKDGKDSNEYLQTSTEKPAAPRRRMQRHRPCVQTTPNFAFAIEAETGLDLAVRGYGSGNQRLFSEEHVDSREIYLSKPHYIVHVDGNIIFADPPSRVYVEDLSGKWSLLPKGGKGEICDDKPTDNRGTYRFVARTFPGAPVSPAAINSTPQLEGPSTS